MARDRPLNADDEDLDVIDLLAEDPLVVGARRDPEPERTNRGPRPPRWLVLTVAIALVASTIGIVAATRNPTEEATVGLASDDTGDAAAPATTLPSLPRLAAPVLGDVGGQFAVVLRDRLVLLDASTGRLVGPPTVPATNVTVVDANAGTMLARAAEQMFLVGVDGETVEIADDTVFPTAQGERWWRVHDDETLVPTDGGDTITLPRDTKALGAIRDGFLLQHQGSNALLAWTPGGATRPLAEGGFLALVAIHPDRVAWVGGCPGANCGLHVTDVASSTTSTLGVGVMPLFMNGWAKGRFSADGRLLGLIVSSDPLQPQEFVLVDLLDGRVVMREMIRNAAGTSVRSPTNAVPFDFDAAGSRVVVATTRPRAALMAFDTATGQVVGSSQNIGAISSLASLDRTTVAASTELFSAPPAGVTTGATIATLDANARAVTLVGIDGGAPRVVEIPAGPQTSIDQWGPMLVALDAGFLVTERGNATWIPMTGDPVSLAAADYITRSTDRSEAWLVSSEDSRAYRVRRVDGSFGTLGPPIELRAPPSVSVDGRLAHGVAGSFESGGAIEVYDPGTRRSTTLPVDSLAPQVTTAVGRELLWFDGACNESRGCSPMATNIESGETRALPAEADIWSSAAGGDGRMYVRDSSPGSSNQLILVDPATLATESVPDSSGLQQFAASASGVVVFSTNDGVLTWMPGWDTSRRLTSGTFGDVAAIAVR